MMNGQTDDRERPGLGAGAAVVRGAWCVLVSGSESLTLTHSLIDSLAHLFCLLRPRRSWDVARAGVQAQH